MYKKFLFAIVALSIISLSGLSYAEPATKAPAKTTAAPAKAATKASAKPKELEKPATKTTPSEDEKYAIVYDKCIKEAEKDESKYDQEFNSCMEKNGFPQEEYETGGQPMDAIEGQDN